MKEDINCLKCGKKMEYLGHINGITLTSNPPQWDEHYRCTDCKVFTKKRVRGAVYQSPMNQISGYEETKSE